MPIRKIALALGTCLALLAPVTVAAVIDFENPGAVDCTVEAISSEGYSFNGAGPRCVFGPGDEGIENANNGSYFLIDARLPMTLTNDAGLPFSLTRIDLGISYYNDVSPNFMILTGLFADGATISRTLTLTDSFQTFALSGFENLSALTFSNLLIPASDGDPGYIAIDNVVLPLPASLPLFALAIGVMAAVRRRYR